MRLVYRLLHSRRAWVILAITAVGWAALGTRSWLSSRTVIRAVKGAGGICEVGPSSSVMRDYAEWILTDAGIRRIHLNLVPVPAEISDHLSELSDLEGIDFIRCRLREVDLEALGKKQGLLVLRLTGSNVTDSGMRNIAGLINLRVLDLVGTNISDAGLVHLGGMTSLEWLMVDETAIGDSSLADISQLTSLRYLHMRRTRITDTGLTHLRGMKKLARLDLTQTAVTPAAVDELKKALPNCTVIGP